MTSPTQAQAASATRQDYRFFHRLRVRWVEVDMQKIVFNGHYLMYFDTAVADYWRALALPYEAAMHQLGGDLYVKKATVEYHASARYDDVLDIGMKCSRVGNSSMLFTGDIFCGDQRLISGELLYVFADPATQTSKPVPQVLRDLFAGFEAGEPMTTIEVGDWATLGRQTSQIRHEVFVTEQRFSAELEIEEADAIYLHALATNRMGMPVATGRLLAPKPSEPGVARIGRMAVTRVLRGSHLGRNILDRLMLAAKTRGDTQVRLHAQCSAQGFYARLGFTPMGDVFDEEGVAHIEMARSL
jgi:YbgC/YbaW family acyl-CoA thioester hydrolase